MKDQRAILNPTGSALRKIPKPVRVIGIDLGTTNSTVAEIVWHPEKDTELTIRCLEVDQETQSGLYTHTLVPSAVALHNGKEWVGEGAKRLHARAPEFSLELHKNIFLECKNDIGAKKTYHKAPEGYRSAAEVSARILAFLQKSAAEQDAVPITRTVVTVPASFQASQRIDTVRAAEIAGIALSGGDLLDEPVAAFLDYLLSHVQELKGVLAKPRNLLVFDFGGGTCDVAIFCAGKAPDSSSLQIHPLAVSRYHRLGGGDIDRAVLFDVLIPQLVEQNRINSVELSFDDKKNFIEPALLGVAESLKIGLCNEIARLRAFGQYDTSDKTKVVKIQPGSHACRIGERVLQLNSPTLSAAQFEELLKPFLDTDLLYARETEYRLTCSIFAPLQDALDRSKLAAGDIDLCLMVGGSSLIPQIPDAVAKFFPKAKPLTFPGREGVQLAVARGAAAHALALALYGKSIFQVAAPDRIAIRTTKGSYELFPKGTPLPFPSGNDWRQSCDLAVSESSLVRPVDMRVEILGGEGADERSLLNTLWQIPAPVSRGDKVCLEYRMDENQVLHFRLSMEDREDAPTHVGKIENPLSNVVNPHAKRMKIQADEEDLRTGAIPKEKIPDKVVEIARDYEDIGQTEKAISYLKQALRIKNRPDGYILNLLGIYHGTHGDFESQEKCYREAAAAGSGETSLFNLALAQFRRKKNEEARKTMQECLVARRSDGPSLTLAAQIEEALGQKSGRDDFLKQALDQFGEPRTMDEWEIGWLITAAKLSGKEDVLKKAQAEKDRRAKTTASSDTSEGVLPEVSGTIQKI